MITPTWNNTKEGSHFHCFLIIIVNAPTIVAVKDKPLEIELYKGIFIVATFWEESRSSTIWFAPKNPNIKDPKPIDMSAK